MMRFKEFLEETFSSPYAFTWSKKSNTRWLGKFFSGNDQITVEIYLKNNQNIWEVVFDRNKSTEKTGWGDQFKIFATVIAMIEDFLKNNSPDGLRFSAQKDKDENSSRAKLYIKMCDKFATANGFDFSYTMAVHDDYDETYFTLTKI